MQVQYNLCSCLLFFLTSGCFSVNCWDLKPIPLVMPANSKSHLDIQKDGLDFLSSIDGPISPIVVIGPYRSGKSFLLNQLLGLPCDTGFGVGHTRTTQTKGIWLWGEPQVKEMSSGTNLSVIYIDTEGFESTGKSNAYDDRIFALSALLSSVLVYNLPETIRESDVEKLSFAVELSRGFYEKDRQKEQGGAGTDVVESADSVAIGRGLKPCSMLWLLQRDFLQGASVAEVVKELLTPVPNPNEDPEIQLLNSVRAGLADIAPRSTGFGLRQPHLERTRLCELADSELDPVYVRQRQELKQLVKKLAHPKVVGGKDVTGADLAALVSRMVRALNSAEIPSATTLLASFNRDAMDNSLKEYTSAMDSILLPADEAAFERADVEARGNSIERFKSRILGRSAGSSQLLQDLAEHLEKEWLHRQTANLAASTQVCQEQESRCQSLLDSATSASLPSLHTFESKFAVCEAAFKATCVGPARSAAEKRLHKAVVRSRTAFSHDYNDKLYSGLLCFSLASALIFRFLLHIRILEAAGWLGFLVLELYPHAATAGLSTGLYDTRGWKFAVGVWEWCAWAMTALPGLPFFGVLAIAGCYLGWRLWSQQQQRKRAGKKLSTTNRDLDV